MPDVSIIIPVYNRIELLPQTLISCAIQTFRDCEVLIVDDGSEQDVPGVVERTRALCGGCCRFRWVRQKHQGAPAARNRGLQEATGRFIQFLDSDDLLHPHKIDLQRSYLLDQPDLDMVFGLDEFFHKVPGDMAVLWNTPGEPALDRFLREDPVWHTGSPLWKRGALERFDAWDERLLCYQDWEYHIRALCRGLRYAHLPVVLQYIRDHEASRISTAPSLTERERAKVQAALAVAGELTRESVWSRVRSDAVAVFLLQSALKLRQVDSLRLLIATLAKAVRHAGSLRLRLAALALLSVAALSGLKRSGRRDSLERVYELAQRLRAIPTYRSNWKRSVCASAKVPVTLLQALERCSLIEVSATPAWC